MEVYHKKLYTKYLLTKDMLQSITSIVHSLN